MKTIVANLALLASLAAVSEAFLPASTTFCENRIASISKKSLAPSIVSPSHVALAAHHHRHRDVSTTGRSSSLFRRIAKKLDAIESAGFDTETTLVSGPLRRIKDLHNPITYLVLALIAGFRWDWCFRNPYYWFAVGFCIKWYRARYVFKIPVWDRQPNWNNIITSKEQEKDLKAYTCKKCGSTLFIAKTREFFFEGDTGIGGLGCFSCGAKGKENFVMDRDRIVEDVADMDDYFEYERPLDFVSRAERRKLLKETKGDEEKANQILLERAEQQKVADTTEPQASSQVTEEAIVEPEIIDTSVDGSDDSSSSSETEEPKKAKKKKKSKKSTPSPPPSSGNGDLDELGMDDF